jgi:hypothetical protein
MSSWLSNSGSWKLPTPLSEGPEMRWPKRCKKKEDVEVPSPEDGRAARIEAEEGLRQTRDRWSAIHDVSSELERIRERSGPDPFVEELAQAMKPRPRHHREA